MLRQLAFVIASILFASNSVAQIIPDYDLGGASKPKPDLTYGKQEHYKRIHQTSLRLILRGDLDTPETFLNAYRVTHPADAETLYMLGILQGQRGDLKKAEDLFKQAIAAGLPEGRLLAGPRLMLKPLVETDLLKSLQEKFTQQLVHGPLVGNVTGNSASFWVRTATECEIEVIASVAENSTTPPAVDGPVPKDDEQESGQVTPSDFTHRSTIVKSKADEDFTAVAVLNGLQPNTEYQYSIVINRNSVRTSEPLRFRTLASAGKPAKFAIAFGGGAGYVPENERMWNTIGRFDPHAILLLGDNVYIDDPESVVMQQYTYQRRQSRPEWRKLTARSPVFTIWDDHDFSTNDSWGGADIDLPFWKKDWAFPIFRQNWANPGYGGGDAQPGCWYAFQIGDVDFIMLDCRYYRTDPKRSPKSMLGPVQKQWLKQQLTSAKGTFKVLCSSVPWDFRTKGDSLDTWNGYKEEHEEILSLIERERIEGVVLMSADRHRSDCWKIARPNGYDLYEFNSSRLTNQHIHPTRMKEGAIFSYNDPQSFGLVSFDTTRDDPHVTYEVVNINGQKPHAITVQRSQLGF